MTNLPECPSCKREFKDVFDYPRISIMSYNIPYRSGGEPFTLWEDGKDHVRIGNIREGKPSIDNVVSVVKKLRALPETLAYLSRLEELAKASATLREAKIDPKELKPLNLAQNSYFNWAYDLTDAATLGVDIFTYNKFYLAPHCDKEKPGQCDIALWLTGPNFGSAGGPTLQVLATLAEIKYTGHLAE